MCCKEMGSKVDCFAGFCQHCWVIMDVHTCTYCYPLFESGTKTGLWIIAICRKCVELLRKHKCDEI